MNALSELKRYINKYRQIKNFLIEQREREEYEEKKIDNMINELEEVKNIEAELKELLNEKEKSCQKLEIEMVDLKRKVEANNNVHDRLKNNSIIVVFPFWVSTLKFVSQIVLLLAYALLKRFFLNITLVTDSSPPLSVTNVLLQLALNRSTER